MNVADRSHPHPNPLPSKERERCALHPFRIIECQHKTLTARVPADQITRLRSVIRSQPCFFYPLSVDCNSTQYPNYGEFLVTGRYKLGHYQVTSVAPVVVLPLYPPMATTKLPKPVAPMNER